MIRTALIGVAVLATMVTPIQALTITQTQGFAGTPNFETSVQFDRFDPERGVLQSVEWQFEMRIEGGTLTVDNDGPLPATVRVELGATGEMSSQAVRLIDGQLSPIFSGNSKLALSTGSDFELAGDNGDGMTFDPTMPDAATHEGGIATVSGAASVSPTVFDDYLGTTLFDLDVNINQLLDFGGKGGVSGQFDPVTAFADIRLIYEYVPEPTSIVSTWVGLWGLIVTAHRRVKSS